MSLLPGLVVVDEVINSRISELDYFDFVGDGDNSDVSTILMRPTMGVGLLNGKSQSQKHEESVTRSIWVEYHQTCSLFNQRVPNLRSDQDDSKQEIFNQPQRRSYSHCLRLVHLSPICQRFT